MLTGEGTPTGEVTPETQVKLALASKYEIIEEIGRGGMASVYKAVQKNLNRTVALKVIHQNLIHDKEFLERFHREAQLAASLNHHNIVTIHDEGQENGVHYISMEYLDGEDLHHIIRRKGKLGLEETINIITPIAEALDYAHSKCVIHRDIKSSNIIITTKGKPVLTDFGIAHAATGTKLTQTGTIIGTPEYMSPEQAEGKEVDARSDLYSLGVVMYECLTGRVPFRGDNPITVIRKIIDEKPTEVKEIDQEIPDWLNNIETKLLSKNKTERYITGKELSESLRAEKAGKVQSTKDSDKTRKIDLKETPKIPERKSAVKKEGLRGKKISPLIYALSGSLMILLMVLGYLLINRNSETENKSPETVEITPSQKHKIEQLIKQAEKYIAENKLTTPAGNNAYETVMEIISIDHENYEAKNLLTKIVDKYEELGDEDYNSGNYSKAILYYTKGTAIDENNIKLKNKIESVNAKIEKSKITISENFEEGKEVEAVNFRELKALLPEDLDGLNRTSATGEKTNAFGINVSKAESVYKTENNSSRITITIVDMGGMSGWAGMAAFGWTMTEIDKETEDGYERTIEYKGYKGFEKYTTNRNDGKKEVMVAKRFMVTVEGDNVPMEAIDDAMDKIDLDDLEEMKMLAEKEKRPG